MIGEILGLQFDVSLAVLLVIGLGWLFLIWAIAALVVVFMWTPAKTFLAAKIRKLPVIKVNYRDGLSEFKIGKRDVPGSLSVKGIGPFDIVEGSQTRDKSSGMPIYESFAESATSFPLEYSAILTELRSKGFAIKDFSQYRALVDIVVDENKRKEYRASLVNYPEKLAVFEEKYKTLKNMNIELKPFKSVRVHELANMFPYDMNPSYVEEYSTAQLTAFQRKHKMNKEMMIYAAVGVFILVIAAFVAMRLLQGDAGPAQVTVEISRDVLQTAAQSNSTSITV